MSEKMQKRFMDEGTFLEHIVGMIRKMDYCLYDWTKRLVETTTERIRNVLVASRAIHSVILNYFKQVQQFFSYENFFAKRLTE